jgi:hypothetical protein
MATSKLKLDRTEPGHYDWLEERGLAKMCELCIENVSVLLSELRTTSTIGGQAFN